MAVYYCSEFPELQTGFACPRAQSTRTVERLLRAIAEDFTERGIAVWDFSAMLGTYCRLFNLNEIEVSAWYCCLLEILAAGQDCSRVASLLWFAAFHVKSILCGDVESLTLRLKLYDRDFETQMTDWFLSAPSFPALSLPNVHKAYAHLLSFSIKLPVIQSHNDTIRSVSENYPSSDSESEAYTPLIPMREDEKLNNCEAMPNLQ